MCTGAVGPQMPLESRVCVPGWAADRTQSQPQPSAGQAPWMQLRAAVPVSQALAQTHRQSVAHRPARSHSAEAGVSPPLGLAVIFHTAYSL